MVDPKILEIEGNRPGPTLAIFAGVHGNERAGVYALQELLPTLKPTRGKLRIAFANPEAIDANVRMLNKNLNRCFTADNHGDAPEDRRARQLMAVLDKSDALLDLHMFYDDDGRPFVICEENALDVARCFDVDIISTNWTQAEPGGSDGYMFEQGKIGICVECGPIAAAQDYTDFAKQVVYQFLQYFDMSPVEVAYSKKPKRIIAAAKTVYRSSASFKLTPGYKNFDTLTAGEVIAVDVTQTYRAGEQECIIFPHYKARIGEEAYIIGKEKRPVNF